METPLVSSPSHVDATRGLAQTAETIERGRGCLLEMNIKARTNSINYQPMNSSFGRPLFQRNVKAEEPQHGGVD